MKTLKLVCAAALILITAAAWPNPRYGAMIAIGVCIMAALAFHFRARTGPLLDTKQTKAVGRGGFLSRH